VLINIDDKNVLAAFFARDEALHLYEIGDLDAFFWTDTSWFGWQESGGIRAVALLYSGSSVPTLILLERTHESAAARLLDAMLARLPHSYYAHLSPNLSDRLGDGPRTSHGRHLKMILRSPELLSNIDGEGAEALSEAEQEELKGFYERSYPENWFMPRMLETGEYFGIRIGGELVAVAGVHVFSPEYRVAALGNITTHPEYRGRGLGRRVTAHLCRSLLRSVDTIGLNVHADNHSAIRCYRALGFAPVAEYGEFMVGAAR